MAFLMICCQLYSIRAIKLPIKRGVNSPIISINAELVMCSHARGGLPNSLITPNVTALFSSANSLLQL